MLFTLLAFALALGILITFHEFGHYWVARRCGVKVLRFSIGFGKVLAQRVDRNGTEWALSAIPLGGYVKMLDDPLPGDPPGQADQAFNRKSVGKRMAIVAAGPIANLVLAALFYTILNLAGSSEPAAVLAAPPAHTAAAQAGFQKGDRLVSIGNSAIRSWNEARWRLFDTLTSGGQVKVAVDTEQGARRVYTLQLAAGKIESDKTDLMAQAGLNLAAPRPQVSQVSADGAGAAAGLQAGDIITAVDDLRNPTLNALVAQIQARPGRPVRLQVLRQNGAATTLMLTPKPEIGANGIKIGRIGVLLGADFPMVTVRYGLIDSFTRGVSRTADTTWLSLKMMGRMVTGNISLRNVSGPVTIADYAGQTARLGWAAYLSFLALISVSIGVLNLLPIPMLDGGHLMYYLLEIARGKPVPEKWRVTGQQVGLGLLAALMGLAFFNDFSRLFS